MRVETRTVRGCFVPRPGYCFIDADISAMELATLAQVEIWTLGNRTKADQINSGLDLHCITGACQARMSYEDFYDVAVVQKLDWADAIRQTSKISGFGKPGGMADTTLIGFARASYGVTIGATKENPRPSRAQQEVEAVRLGNFWREANPHDQDYLAFIRKLRKGDRYEVIIGHPCIGVYARRGKATYCAAANSLFQGLGALAAGEITYRVQRASYAEPDSPLYGSRMVAQVYDEWLLETPIERVTEAAAELERHIREGGARMVPDVVFRTEALAMAEWDKKAKRVVRDGQLLVWGTEECAEEYARQRAA